MTGADRAAAVWVDEHGTGLIHPYVVVDFLSARPRRAFASEPLRAAWQLGVPSALDAPADPASAAPTTFAVALGSDGTRAWFVVADSALTRPPIANEVRDRLMFAAGECAALVLHRDLDEKVEADPCVAGARFAGWDILADLDGRESDELESRRIAQRFVVARLVRLLVDDDLTASRERTVEQVRRARSEVSNEAGASTEGQLWQATLNALEDERFEDLASTLVNLGDVVEGQVHTKGAEEIYDCAYRVGAAIGAARSAAQAARLRGRLVRRQANWAESRRWFDVAREVAEAGELPDVLAQVLVGLAGITRETGNLPAARAELGEALAVAERPRDADSVAVVHHALLGLEQQSGDLPAALHHGWQAMATYASALGRMRCLAGLAGALLEYGDRDAAEDAWQVVAASCPEKYYRVFAHDALSHISAMRGDRAGFAAWSRECDALGWDVGENSAKAEILLHRGLSHQALGEYDPARSWLLRARDFAEEHRYHRVYFKAEAALAALVSATAAEPLPTPAAPPELRERLRAMRRELVGAGVD
ncbi:MAG: hypothetical protein FJ207_00605 [Gemmatimonadetes bacterium]|nr:hypothetical protein [Gemmatimonadota bacterium]